MTQQEFEHIYSSIKADLMRLAGQFCRSTSLDLDAEDAVQEAFIAFWELTEQGYPMPNPKALLVKITKNICISRYRKRRLESANHLLQHCKTGSAEEYKDIEETIAPEVLEMMVGWIMKTK